MKKKVLTILCGAWLMGAVAMAASPALIPACKPRP